MAGKKFLIGCGMSKRSSHCLSSSISQNSVVTILVSNPSFTCCWPCDFVSAVRVDLFTSKMGVVFLTWLLSSLAKAPESTEPSRTFINLILPSHIRDVIEVLDIGIYFCTLHQWISQLQGQRNQVWATAVKSSFTRPIQWAGWWF